MWIIRTANDFVIRPRKEILKEQQITNNYGQQITIQSNTDINKPETRNQFT